MWYWTIPSFAITAACLYIPSYINAAGNWAVTGHVNLEKEIFF